METMDVGLRERELQPPLYAGRDLVLVRGEGAVLWDSAGNAYIDAMSNYGVNVLGHAHPAVIRAIANQAGTLLNCHQSFSNDIRARFLQRLTDLAPSGLTRAFLSNSGTEAIEAGLKFARIASGRTKLLAARGGYHGRTIGALAATADKKYREPFVELLGDVTHVPYNDLDALSEAADRETVAIVLEPLQGEAGIRVPSSGYLAGAREIASDVGALLVVDEVQTALRTGKIFASEHDGVKPDILCTAKGLANGVPIGATLMTEEISSALGSGIHGSTFGGNPLACAAGLATLHAIEDEGLLAASIESGEQLRDGIRSLDNPLIRDVRGVGLMIGVEFRTRVTPILKGLQQRGILALPAGNLVIRFLPPLVIAVDQVELIVEAMGETLVAVQATERVTAMR